MSNVTEAQHAAASQLLLSFLDADSTGMLLYACLGMGPAYFITGYCTLQLSEYLSNPNNKDPRWVKWLMIALMCLLAAHISIQSYNVWGLVMNFNTYYLWFPTHNKIWAIEIVFISVLIGPAAMAYIGWRTWNLYRRPLIGGTIGVTLLIGMVVSGCLSAAHGASLDIDTHQTVSDILANFAISWQTELTARLTAFVAIDLVLNVSLTIASLLKFKSFLDDGGTRSVIRRLVVIVMTSMVPNCVVTVLLTYLFIRNIGAGTRVFPLFHIQPPLYVLACLTAVNSKKSIEQALLSNNLQLNLISDDTDSPGTVMEADSRGIGQDSGSREGDRVPSFVDDDFLNVLATGPEDEQSRKSPRLEKLGVSFGKSKAVLADEEKGK